MFNCCVDLDYAAKDTIGNFFGSVAIFLDRPFQIGDWVTTTDVQGEIEHVVSGVCDGVESESTTAAESLDRPEPLPGTRQHGGDS